MPLLSVFAAVWLHPSSWQSLACSRIMAESKDLPLRHVPGLFDYFVVHKYWPPLLYPCRCTASLKLCTSTYRTTDAHTVMMLAPRAVKRKVTAKAAHATGLSDSGVSTPSAGDAEDTDEAGAANAKSSAILDGYQAVDSPANGLKDSKDEEQCTGAAESKIDNEQAKSVASTSESKKDRKEQERLNLLRFTVEECLSDWGLSCLHPELLQTCKDSKTGCMYTMR